MQRILTPQGNGWIMIIPKTVIKLLGIVPATSNVQLRITNKILYVQEISPENPDFEKFLVKKLSRKNTSWGLYMPNSILELLDINPETDKLELDIQDNILIVKKAVV